MAYTKPLGYVVYYCESLRDGQEDGGKLFHTKEQALAFIEDAANRWFAASNHTFQLFELGKEIPIQLDDIKTEERKVTVRKKASIK